MQFPSNIYASYERDWCWTKTVLIIANILVLKINLKYIQNFKNLTKYNIFMVSYSGSFALFINVFNQATKEKS